jgi:formaldehyde-activating enzyme
VIPASEADDIFICVGVFIHWEAADDAKIQDYNYRAVKESIARAIAGKPTALLAARQLVEVADHIVLVDRAVGQGLGDVAAFLLLLPG